MSDPFAATTDVQAVWPTTLTDQQLAMAQARLVQASAIIREEVGLVGGRSVDQRAIASTSFADLVRGIARDMVVRLLQNPQGRTTVQIDDSNISYDAAISSGQLYLSDAEYRLLTGVRRRMDGMFVVGAFTIRPYHMAAYARPDPWRHSWDAPHGWGDEGVRWP